eukprot:1182143-Prorocentrum_minimum.AAC.1
MLRECAIPVGQCRQGDNICRMPVASEPPAKYNTCGNLPSLQTRVSSRISALNLITRFNQALNCHQI